MSRIPRRFALWSILTFSGAAALVLAAGAPRPASASRPAAASGPVLTAFGQQAQRPDAVAFRKPRVRECSKNRDCDDGNVCTQDRCDKHTWTCEFKPVHRRQTCDDGNACTSRDVCDRGVCQGRNRPNGTVCSDGNACTQSDTCQSGACTGAAPVTCSASDQCHVTGACNPATGACSNPAAPDGTACADGNACTQTDSCQQGACTGADPVICSPSDQCHVAGTCDTATGSCANPAAPDGTACDDTETCSGQDVCEAGACTVPGAVVQKIAFSTTRDKPVPDPGTLAQVNLEVYLMNPDGTGEVRLTNNNGVNDSFAALSPDGKGRIVFDSARGTPAGSPPNLVDLYLMRSDGSNVQYLVRGSSASWSPDSQSIAFHRSASGAGLPINQFPGAPAADSDIFVARVCDLLAGLPPTNITNTVGMVDTDASWSPDGTKILFTRFSAADNPQTPTSAEVFYISPDGTGETQLTFNAVEERSPSWSNNGTRIVYACKQGTVPPNSDNELCVMNPDGTGQTQLTFNTTNDATATFSPDDTKIIFHSGQLFTMNPDGTGRTQITFAAGISQYADWGFVRFR